MLYFVSYLQDFSSLYLKKRKKKSIILGTIDQRTKFMIAQIMEFSFLFSFNQAITDSVLGWYWKLLPFIYGYGSELTQKRKKLRTEEKPQKLEQEQQGQLSKGTEMGWSEVQRYVSLEADQQLSGRRYH